MKLLQLLCACCMFACALACATAGQTRSDDPMPSDLVAAQDAAWAYYGNRPIKPRIQVITRLTCRNSPGDTMLGFGRVGVQTDGGCLGGLTVDYRVSQVAYWGQPWHETVLCHEDLHQDQARRGIIDWQHERVDEWGELLDGCIAALVQAGQ